MKTYKGLRAILGALWLSLLALAPAHAAPRLSISPLGLQITQVQEVDAISGTRTVTEWELNSEAE